MKKFLICLLTCLLTFICFAGCGKTGKTYYTGGEYPDPTTDPEQYIPTYEMPYTYDMTYVSGRECEFEFSNYMGKDITLSGNYLLFLAQGSSENQQPLEWAKQPPEGTPVTVGFEQTVTLRYNWEEYIPNGALPTGDYVLMLTATDAEGNSTDIPIPMCVMDI